VVKRRVVVRSFTSMARHHLSQLGEGASFGEQLPRAEDETATLVDIEDPLRGPVFGDMVHKVFENIDFAEVGRAGSAAELCLPGAHARKCLDQAIQPDLGQLRTRTPFDQLMEAARRQIALLVWQTLKTPLAALGGPLCDVRDGDRLHEVEFLFPERPGEPVPANKHFEEGFVTGYMDLLLRRDERYFLLDWKTNLLPGYTREQIDRNMAESDYHRQYRLYLNAARRWLERRLGPSFDWAKGFGGVYYLYVRGMNGRDESTGVFFHCPTDRDLDLTLALRE
jgi:exodeoxyribonuclease V beta subunit